MFMDDSHSSATVVRMTLIPVQAVRQHRHVVLAMISTHGIQMSKLLNAIHTAK